MKKTVVILALVLSLAVNVTQFLVFKQSNNQEVIETKEQTVNQEKEILKGTIKERENESMNYNLSLIKRTKRLNLQIKKMYLKKSIQIWQLGFQR